MVDVATHLRNTPGGPPLLVYLNCCLGNAGGLLGAGLECGQRTVGDAGAVSSLWDLDV